MSKNSFLAPFTKLARGVRERGWGGVVEQLYTIGDLKFGVFKGMDSQGNKYYEDLEQPFGQHRWVEYKNIHNPDATMIQPEWHGWMHHAFDETPDEMNKLEGKKHILPTTDFTHAIYSTHIGKTDPIVGGARQQVDTSQYRQRGYKVGSLMTSPEDQDHYYKQPGHPLSKENGRFEKRKEQTEWTPDAPSA